MKILITNLQYIYKICTMVYCNWTSIFFAIALDPMKTWDIFSYVIQNSFTSYFNVRKFFPALARWPLRIRVNFAGTHDDVIKWKHFRVPGPLWGEYIGHRRIPLTKASNMEQTVAQTVDMLVIWVAWCSLWRHCHENTKCHNNARLVSIIIDITVL